MAFKYVKNEKGSNFLYKKELINEIIIIFVAIKA